MTPKELRNERLAERMIKNLKRRNMEAFYCKTSEETIQKVLELIPDGSSITWGGSMTIRDMGLPDALRKNGPRPRRGQRGESADVCQSFYDRCLSVECKCHF